MNVKALAQWLKDHLLTVWLVLALGSGVTYIFVIQPLHGNDEIVHFPRAYHVQEGNLWNEHLSGYDYGGQMPLQIKQFNDGFREQVQNNNPSKTKLRELKEQYSGEKLTDERREPLAFTSAGVYSAWSYLPAALGIKLARLLDLPLIWYVYLARVMCLLVWVALTALALRLLPFGRTLLFMVALLPTSVVQASTIGMDGIVNGLSWLIIALTLAVIANKVRPRLPIFLALALISMYLATTKQGYVLIAALPLLIPAALYPASKKAANIARIGFGLLLIGISVWYFRQTAPIADVMHFIQRPGLSVDSATQWRYIFSHPLQVLAMIVVQPFTPVYGGIYGGVVGILTNRMVWLPLFIIGLLYAGLFVGFARQEKVKKLAVARSRLYAAAAAVLLGTLVLISLALYVSFTKIGHPHVEGIQGRYFLPLLPLLAVFGSAVPGKLSARFDVYRPIVLCLIAVSGLLAGVGAIL